MAGKDVHLLPSFSQPYLIKAQQLGDGLLKLSGGEALIILKTFERWACSLLSSDWMPMFASLSISSAGSIPSHSQTYKTQCTIQLNLDKWSPPGAEKTARLQYFSRLARPQCYAHT